MHSPEIISPSTKMVLISLTFSLKSSDRSSILSFNFVSSDGHVVVPLQNVYIAFVLMRVTSICRSIVSSSSEEYATSSSFDSDTMGMVILKSLRV